VVREEMQETKTDDWPMQKQEMDRMKEWREREATGRPLLGLHRLSLGAPCRESTGVGFVVAVAESESGGYPLSHRIESPSAAVSLPSLQGETSGRTGDGRACAGLFAVAVVTPLLRLSG